MMVGMAPTTWHPSEEEVRRIVAELRPVIDECERRALRQLAADQVDGAAVICLRRPLLSA